MSKHLQTIDAALQACEIRDGASVSFHHHLRNGDQVLNLVMEALAKRGLRDLHVVVTSVFPVHEPLIAHMKSGVVRKITSDFISGPVGLAISQGALEEPVLLQSHGGRARAIDQGEIPIDVAFVAASMADHEGNLSGRGGPSQFGVMGYPLVDVDAAKFVVGITDALQSERLGFCDIPAEQVDYVVEVKSIGDSAGIASGTTRPAQEPSGLAIAQNAVAVIAASGLLTNGFRFQTGAGSISLATSRFLGEEMARRGIVGDFVSGGITGYQVELLQAGLFERLLDVQCFDLAAAHSYRDDPRHQAMSARQYAGPHIPDAVANQLDAVILGATEVDLDFNVNVTTRAGGVIAGGAGGHSDVAAGSKLSIITTKLNAAGYAKIVPTLGTSTTPGATVDVVVTDGGIAVNPARGELIERLQSAQLPLMRIEELATKAKAQAERPTQARSEGRVVALSEYRDGTISDVIRCIEEPA